MIAALEKYRSKFPLGTTLFDLGLIAVHPEQMKVVLSPKLGDSAYSEFENVALRVPLDTAKRPSQEALRRHLEWARL